MTLFRLVPAFLAALASPGALAVQNQLLVLSDPSGVVPEAPTLRIVSGDGTVLELHPRDDGQDVDMRAGDRSFSATAPLLAPGRYTFTVPTASDPLEGTLEAQARATDKPVLYITLKTGRLVVEETDPAGMGRREGGAGRGRTLETTASVDLSVGLYLLLLAVGAGQVGAALWFLARARSRPRPARLVGGGTPHRFSPQRVARADLPALLAGPLAGYRRVRVGGGVPGESDLLVEPGALPGEVVAAVEDLAVRPGPPVALVVEDPAALDAQDLCDPLAALESRVDGRFPLVVVQPGS